MAELSIDTSIYAPKPRANPLEMIGNIAAAKSAIVGANKAQFELTGQQLLAKAMQQAFDPATGTFDPVKLGKILADPAYLAATLAGADAMLNATGKMLGNTGQAITNQEAMRGFKEKQFKSVGDAFKGLASSATPPTEDDVQRMLNNLWDQKLIDTQSYRDWSSKIPSDPAEVRKFALDIASATSDMTVRTPLTPGPSGAARTGTGRAALEEDGAPAAAPVKGGGPSVPAAGVTEGIPPVVEDAGKKAGSAILAGQAESGQILANLRRMEQTSDNFTAGPGANEWYNAVSALNTFLPADAQIDPSKVADKQEFDKLMAQLSIRIQANMGSTDSQLSAAVAASPHAELSNAGIKKILHMMMGDSHAGVIMAKAYKDAGTPVDANGWLANEWLPNFDPRIYQLQFMDAGERASLTAYMKKHPDQAQEFSNKIAIALDNGWVTKQELTGSPK